MRKKDGNATRLHTEDLLLSHYLNLYGRKKVLQMFSLLQSLAREEFRGFFRAVGVVYLMRGMGKTYTRKPSILNK